MNQPNFIFERVDPDVDHVQRVYLKNADGTRGDFLGLVSETGGAGWIADHNPDVPKPARSSAYGFESMKLAAEFLYWFEPPVQSRRSRAKGAPKAPDYLNPDLIPVPGVLFALQPFDNGAYLATWDTRGAGTGMAYLHPLEDGRYEVQINQRPLGKANTPEVGLYAAMADFIRREGYARWLEGFEPVDQ